MLKACPHLFRVLLHGVSFGVSIFSLFLGIQTCDVSHLFLFVLFGNIMHCAAGGIEAYCKAAVSVMHEDGIFCVCENWLNNDRVYSGASAAGLAIISVHH